MIFILAISFYLLSGLKNALYYVTDLVAALFWSIMAFAVVIRYAVGTGNWWGLSFIIPLAIIVRMVIVFLENRTDRVHYFENLLQYSFVLCSVISGVDLITVFTASLVGNVLFNIPIQWYAYKRLFEVNGSWFEVIQFTAFSKVWTINKPRIGNGYAKLAIGILALAAYLINYYFIHYTILL